MTEYTVDKIRQAIQNGVIGHISVKGVEKVIVKGKQHPVGVYEIASIEPGLRSTFVAYESEEIVRMEEK